MNVIKELFVIEDNSKIILYAPLKRLILSVNQDVLLLLQKIKKGDVFSQNKETVEAIDKLRKLGIIDGEDNYNFTSNTTGYKPSRVTFLPTSDCNLRCVYCYANSGTVSKYLSFDVARSALDLIFDNAKEKNESEVHIGFLGGGEPFLAWELIQEIVRYSKTKAEQLGLSTFLGAVSNGMFSRDKALWLTKNFQYLNISLDGMKSIHDKHRPTKNNKGSFDRVIRTINLLNELGFKYSVRSTISSLSIDQMTSIVDFFIKELNVSRIHFEPLFACGRCRTNADLIPDPKVFAANFKKCLDIVQFSNAELFCSAVRLDTLTQSFCGASGENFYITPDGFVTSCTEVSSMDEPLANIFFIGKFDHELKKFVFWNERMKFLSSRTVSRMTNCQHCVAKWHCAGGCPAKAAHSGDIFSTTQLDDCKIARELTEYYIKALAVGQSGFLPHINKKRIDFY